MPSSLLSKEIWDKLSDSLTRRWQINPLRPSCVFWGGVVYIWGLTHNWTYNWNFLPSSTPLLDSNTPVDSSNLQEIIKSIILVTVFYLLVSVSSSIMEWFTFSFLRLLEGYYLPNWFSRRLLKKTRKKIQDKKVQVSQIKKDLVQLNDELKELERKLKSFKNTSNTDIEDTKKKIRDKSVDIKKSSLEYTNIQKDLKRYPSKIIHLQPTLLGNIMRAAEDYPYDCYGLEVYIFGPRLISVLEDQPRQKIEKLRETLNERTRLMAWGVIFLSWAILPFMGKSWNRCDLKNDILIAFALVLISLAIIILSYRALISAAIGYGNYLCALFDLYRFDLYKAMHWPLPTSPESEREQGMEFTRYLFRHRASPNIHFSRINRQQDGLDMKPPQFELIRFKYLINAGQAAFLKSQPSVFHPGRDNLDTRGHFQDVIKQAKNALELYLIHDTELFDVIRESERLEKEPNDKFLNKFLQWERKLMEQADIDPHWREKITKDLRLTIQKLTRIRNQTIPLEPFISWSQPQDIKSRQERIDILKNKNLQPLISDLVQGEEHLKKATVNSAQLKDIHTTLFRFSKFASGITLVFINHSNLVDSSKRGTDFPRLSILLGSILAADCLKEE